MGHGDNGTLGQWDMGTLGQWDMASVQALLALPGLFGPQHPATTATCATTTAAGTTGDALPAHHGHLGTWGQWDMGSVGHGVSGTQGQCRPCSHSPGSSGNGTESPVPPVPPPMAPTALPPHFQPAMGTWGQSNGILTPILGFSIGIFHWDPNPGIFHPHPALGSSLETISKTKENIGIRTGIPHPAPVPSTVGMGTSPGGNSHKIPGKKPTWPQLQREKREWEAPGAVIPLFLGIFLKMSLFQNLGVELCKNWEKSLDFSAPTPLE